VVPVVGEYRFRTAVPSCVEETWEEMVRVEEVQLAAMYAPGDGAPVASSTRTTMYAAVPRVTFNVEVESEAEEGVADTFRGSCTTRSGFEPREMVAVTCVVPAAADDETVTPTAARPDEPVTTLAEESVTPLGADNATVCPATGVSAASVTVRLNVPDVPCANVGEEASTRDASWVTESGV
jgi:hypothetical protein